MQSADATVRIGDRLADRFALLRGETDRSDEQTLAGIAQVFAIESAPYAVIDGVAVQIWSAEPRTTLDVDIAVLSYGALPRAALQAAGFVFGARFPHSENWTGPDGAPVQFTDDPLLVDAVRGAEVRSVGGFVLRVAPVVELVRAKLRASEDPARRRSKRLMDLADACGLAEQHPEVLSQLDERQRRQLES
jgi:hypothetical protein